MNFSKFLSFLFSFVIALYFIINGIVFMMFPWISRMQKMVIRFMTGNTIAISVFGLICLLIGFAVMGYAIINTRHRYYLLRGGAQSIAIDENLIVQYLDSYWQEILPQHEVPCSISIRQNRIHVEADLPHVAYEEQKTLLEKIECDLTELFHKNLGYRKEYILSISFQE